MKKPVEKKAWIEKALRGVIEKGNPLPGRIVYLYIRHSELKAVKKGFRRERGTISEPRNASLAKG